jgi:hypothetical protein
MSGLNLQCKAVRAGLGKQNDRKHMPFSEGHRAGHSRTLTHQCLFALVMLQIPKFKDTPNDIVCPDKACHFPSCKNCTKGFAVIKKLKEIIVTKLRELQLSFAVCQPSDKSSSSISKNSNDVRARRQQTTRRQTSPPKAHPTMLNNKEMEMETPQLQLTGRSQELQSSRPNARAESSTSATRSSRPRESSGSLS